MILTTFRKAKARIEQIEAGHEQHHLLGFRVLKKTPDILDISNRKPNLWVLSVFNGYRQIGQFKIERPHDFREREDVIVHLDKTGKIRCVQKDCDIS